MQIKGMAIGVVTLALSIGVGAPAKATNARTEDRIVVKVNSKHYGWQDTGMNLAEGDLVSMLYRRGKWTVDYRNFPRVGPAGYDWDTDAKIYQGCKIDTDLPYGALLGNTTNDDTGDIWHIGGGGEYGTESGRLYLHINDEDQCLGDNAGSLTVVIIRTRG